MTVCSYPTAVGLVCFICIELLWKVGENFPNSSVAFLNDFLLLFLWSFPVIQLRTHAHGLFHRRFQSHNTAFLRCVASQTGSRVESIVLIITTTTKAPKAPWISSASPHVFFQLSVFLYRPVPVERPWICGAIVNSVLYLFFNLRWRFFFFFYRLVVKYRPPSYHMTQLEEESIPWLEIGAENRKSQRLHVRATQCGIIRDGFQSLLACSFGAGWWEIHTTLFEGFIKILNMWQEAVLLQHDLIWNQFRRKSFKVFGVDECVPESKWTPSFNLRSLLCVYF